jgi:hypothetical protein
MFFWKHSPNFGYPKIEKKYIYIFLGKNLTLVGAKFFGFFFDFQLHFGLNLVVYFVGTSVASFLTSQN